MTFSPTATPPPTTSVLTGTIGPDVIDIRTLYGRPASSPTTRASCPPPAAVAITYIDGDKGVLLYRGYPIEQLAEHCDFLEVAYLMLNGELPTPQQKDFVDRSRTTRWCTSSCVFFAGFRRDAHPMAVLCGVVGALSAFYHDSINIYDPRSARSRRSA